MYTIYFTFKPKSMHSDFLIVSTKYLQSTFWNQFWNHFKICQLLFINTIYEGSDSSVIDKKKIININTFKPKSMHLKSVGVYQIDKLNCSTNQSYGIHILDLKYCKMLIFYD